MSRRPHLLYIAFHFVPSRGSGVFRARATANYFVRAGWDVTVLTVTRDFFTRVTRSADLDLEKTIDPAVVVERVPMRLAPQGPEIASMGWLQANLPGIYGKFWALLRKVPFPDRYASWIPAASRRAVEIGRAHPVDVIVATGNPFASFLVARLAGRILNRPYVMDFRDSWTLNQFTEGDAFRRGHPARVWEGYLVRHAERVVFVNEPQLEWHAQRYPKSAERMSVIENGYDPELLGDVPFRVPDPDRPLRFGYVGTITDQIPMAEFLAAWRTARAAEPVLAGATMDFFGHLGFFGATDTPPGLLIEAAADVGVSWKGPVGKTEVAQAYAGLDVLAMLIPSSRYVTAGKVYEYMAAGKPIVAVHEPWTNASEPLRDYPLWFPVTGLEPRDIRPALRAAGEAARSYELDDHLACRKHAESFARDLLMAPLERDLRGLIDA